MNHFIILLLLFTNVYLLLGILHRHPLYIPQRVKSLRLWVKENVKDIVNIIKNNKNNNNKKELYFTYNATNDDNLELEFDETYDNINRMIFLLIM